MATLRTWNIYTDDGQYLGRADSLQPKIAFCLYKLSDGEVIPIQDITSTEQDDDSCDITYNGSNFLLLPQRR